MSQPAKSHMQDIILVTSDESPIRHTIPRSVLSSFSKTFRDLLSFPLNPTTPSSDEISIVETEVQLKGFLRMLVSCEKGEEADSSDFDFEDWKNLARLSDKYDSLKARMGVKSHVWECIAKDSEHENAFYLAIVLEDMELIQHTCARAIPEKWHQNEQVPRNWQIKISNAFRYRRLRVFEHLNSYPPATWYCARKNACRLPDVDSAWQRAYHSVLYSYSLTQTIAAQLQHHLEKQESPLCASHIARIVARGTSIDGKLPRMLDLKKGSKLDT